MARIIGGIGTSHVPTIAMAFDKGKREDPDWKPLFQGYERVERWLEEKRPDLRARRERRVPDRRRRPGSAPDPAAQGPRRALASHRALAGRRGVRHFDF